MGLVYLFHLWQQRSLPLDKCRNLKSVKFEISNLKFPIQFGFSQVLLESDFPGRSSYSASPPLRWIVNGSRQRLISREIYMAPEMAPPSNPNQAIKRGRAMRSDQQFMTFMDATFNRRKNLLCAPTTDHISMAYSLQRE